MSVCRFFNNGYCRYGSNCRFIHSTNKIAQSAKTDAFQLFLENVSENAKYFINSKFYYPYSCFIVDDVAIEGFDDFSMEELMLINYLSKNDNAINKKINTILSQYVNSIYEKMNLLQYTNDFDIIKFLKIQYMKKCDKIQGSNDYSSPYLKELQAIYLKLMHKIKDNALFTDTNYNTSISNTYVKSPEDAKSPKIPDFNFKSALLSKINKEEMPNISGAFKPINEPKLDAKPLNKYASIDTEFYSPLTVLTDEEQTEFLNEHFTLGMMPLLPPPREYIK